MNLSFLAVLFHAKPTDLDKHEFREVTSPEKFALQ